MASKKKGLTICCPMCGETHKRLSDEVETIYMVCAKCKANAQEIEANN